MPNFAETIPVNQRVASAVQAATTPPRPLEPAELEVEKDRKLDAVTEVVLKVMFNHENRIRALENKAAITAQQFKNALRNLL